MDPKYTYQQLFDLVRVAGQDYDSDLELDCAIIGNCVDVNAVDAQAFHGRGGCIVRQIEFALLLANRMLPDWRWRLNFNGNEYTYTTCKDLMSGEFGEWSAKTPSVAILAAMFQALANVEERKIPVDTP